MDKNSAENEASFLQRRLDILVKQSFEEETVKQEAAKQKVNKKDQVIVNAGAFKNTFFYSEY